MRGPTLSYIFFEFVGVRTKRHRVVLNHHFPLQLATMDKIHREVLGKMTYKIMGRISNPKIFSSHLREIFSTSDIEEIGAKENQKGCTSGTQTMLSILEKRGPKAYELFISALRYPDIKLSDLADELEEEERKLRGKTGTGISFLSCPIPLNVIAISNFSHAVQQFDSYNYIVSRAYRKFPSFFADFSNPEKLSDSFQNIFDNFLNVMKAIKPK